MYSRDILQELEKWKIKENRLPLLIRGARQTGKTTIIKEFGKKFKKCIYLNLEDFDTRKLFTESFQETIQLIELHISQKIVPDETLLILDEIQASLEAVQLLRFFYENMPKLYLICAGSLLEIKLSQKTISFPTGRVEYLFLPPMSYTEYLQAQKKDVHLDVLSGDPFKITEKIHEALLKELYTYFQVGGMPASIRTFIESGSFSEIRNFHTNLFQSFLDDIVKYLPHSKYLETVFEAVPYQIGEPLIYSNYNDSGYKTREIKEAFDILEKAFLVYRLLPTSVTEPPLHHNLSRAPKQYFFDIGLTNTRVAEPYSQKSITNQSSFRGKFAEQFVFQELHSQNRIIPEHSYFWARQKNNAQAEVDFCAEFNNMIIPMEVKSGTTGRLRSLGVFMERAPHKIAIRFYSGLLSVNKDVTTGYGPPFTLVNIPLYLVGRWREIMARVT